MKTEQKLDLIINILYDDYLLLSKEVTTTSFISHFAKKNYKIDWGDDGIKFILTILIDDGYISKNKGDFSGTVAKMPTYSLTTKGIQMKRRGGFAKTKFIDDVKNGIILYGSIIAFIVSIMTITDLGIKFFGSEQVPTCCKPCNKPNQTDANNNSNTTLPKSAEEIKIIKTDTISQPIKKQNIGTTK